MKPSLCIDARMVSSSGIGTYLRGVIPRIAPFFDIHLLLLSKDLSWNKECSIIPFDVPIYTMQEQLLYPLKIPPCDLYWSCHYNIPLAPIQAKKRAVTIHDICHIAHPDFFPMVRRKIAKIVLRQALRRSHIIWTVSNFSKQEIQSHFSCEHPIHVIFGAVEKEIHAKKIPSLTQEPFILFVGNDKPHKNAEALIQAFLRLPSKYQLVLVVPQKHHLPKHPRLHYFHDLLTEDLRYLYTKAIALVHPALYEGFGLVPLEAMQMGCPAIVSNIASLPEVCQDAALYINPLSISSIEEGIKKVLENNAIRNSLIQKGKERAALFSWDNTADQIKNLFLSEILS